MEQIYTVHTVKPC